MALQIAAALIVAAILFDGMVLYSFGFAAFLFTSPPAADAGALLRRAFPHFSGRGGARPSFALAQGLTHGCRETVGSR
jgi:hypothetical protein